MLALAGSRIPHPFPAEVRLKNTHHHSSMIPCSRNDDMLTTYTRYAHPSTDQPQHADIAVHREATAPQHVCNIMNSNLEKHTDKPFRTRAPTHRIFSSPACDPDSNCCCLSPRTHISCFFISSQDKVAPSVYVSEVYRCDQQRPMIRSSSASSTTTTPTTPTTKTA